MTEQEEKLVENLVMLLRRASVRLRDKLGYITLADQIDQFIAKEGLESSVLREKNYKKKLQREGNRS